MCACDYVCTCMCVCVYAGASLASGGSVAHEFPEVSKPMDITAADLFNPTEVRMYVYACT